jgi:hypothetical protein
LGLGDVHGWKTKKPPGGAAPLANGLAISSDVAWGHAASVLRGKIARKGKAEEDGEKIHERQK